MTKQLPLGVRNNNPGNIRWDGKTRWQGQADDVLKKDEFVHCIAPEWGIRMIARTLITYQDARRAKDGSKIDTIREIIERWAPPEDDNNVDAYSSHVADLLNMQEDDTVDVYDYETMKKLVNAIIAHECSNYKYPESVVAEGLKLAGIKRSLPAFLKDPKVVTTTVTAAAGATQQAVYYTDSLWGTISKWGIDPIYLLYGVSAIGLIGGIALLVYLWKHR